MMAKVCGLTHAADVGQALAAGADLLGFLHHPGSPRHCADAELARLAGDRAVLVAVAAEAEALLEQVARLGVAQVQPYLPPGERARALAALRRRGVRVLLPWPDEPDQEPLAASLYLWESSPRATGQLGGSGQGHAMAFPPPGPFLLGGGLHGAILAARLEAMPAAARALCQGFDAASRLEPEGTTAVPRRKDPTQVAAFVRAAHDLAPGFRSRP